MLTGKITCFMDFVVSTDYWMKTKEKGKINKHLDLARELKKALQHKGNCDTNNS